MLLALFFSKPSQRSRSMFYRGVVFGVQNYLKSESTMTVTNETRALTLDACSRLVYPHSQSHVIISLTNKNTLGVCG